MEVSGFREFLGANTTRRNNNNKTNSAMTKRSTSPKHQQKQKVNPGQYHYKLIYVLNLNPIKADPLVSAM